jgi:Fic family protein
LPDLIWNAAALEGNNFTLSEVRTLLDGTTVGGKNIDDVKQIFALGDAYSRLDELVGTAAFSLSKSGSDELHELVAVHEAVEVGHFRGEGSAVGGGNVHLSSGGSAAGTPHGDGGALLLSHYEDLLENLQDVADPRRRALVYFAAVIRRQFYFDGNKRTARMMMTGELISSGYDAVSIPFARKLEFNNALDDMFSADDATELLRFLVSCAGSEN